MVEYLNFIIFGEQVGYVLWKQRHATDVNRCLVTYWALYINGEWPVETPLVARIG